MHQEIFEILFFFLLFMGATGVTASFRSSIHVENMSRDTMRQPPNWHTLLLAPISRSGLILLLTPLLNALIGVIAPESPLYVIDPLHSKGWTIFWTALFLFGCSEGMMRLSAHLRGRALPIAELLISLLRAFYTIVVLLLVVRFVMGINVTPVLTSTAIVSAAAGLALKEVLVDLLDGLIMHLTRSIVPGDWVHINAIEGEVLSTDWHETRLRTTDGHIYVMPNSIIARAVVHNMTWPSAKRRHNLLIPVSYADSVDEVTAALVAAATADAEVLDDPPPAAFIQEFNETGIVYRLRFWSNRYFDRSALQGRIANRVWYEFKRRRIEIPIPVSGKALFNLAKSEQRTLDQQPTAEEWLVTSGFYKSFLSNQDGAPLLAPEQVAQFAGTLRKRIYGPGETIFRQGDPGNSCYIILQGRLNCRIDFPEVSKQTEYEMKAGALFGEIGLVTGLDRSATITALEETHLLEISKESMALLFELDATLPGTLAELAAQRLARSSSDLERLEATAHDQASHLPLHKDTILKRLLSLSKWGRRSP